MSLFSSRTQPDSRGSELLSEAKEAFGFAAATLAYVSFSVLTNQLKNVIVVTVRILRQLVAVKEFRLLDWRLPGCIYTLQDTDKFTCAATE